MSCVQINYSSKLLSSLLTPLRVVTISCYLAVCQNAPSGGFDSYLGEISKRWHSFEGHKTLILSGTLCLQLITGIKKTFCLSIIKKKFVVFSYDYCLSLRYIYGIFCESWTKKFKVKLILNKCRPKKCLYKQGRLSVLEQ